MCDFCQDDTEKCNYVYCTTYIDPRYGFCRAECRTAQICYIDTEISRLNKFRDAITHGDLAVR